MAEPIDHERYQSADPEAGSFGGWNECYTGTRFFTFDPSGDDVRIEDIAHSLSLQCRYNGNCRRLYSVAEHSCLLADFVRPRGWHNLHAEYPITGAEFRRDALTMLMHDAAEAYIGDLVRPVKHRMPEFKALERTIEHAVFPVYGLDPEIPSWARDLDTRILRDERWQVMLTQDNEWVTDDLEPLDVAISFWRPERAEYEFLRRFHELYNQYPYWEARRRALRTARGSRPWWGLLGG